MSSSGTSITDPKHQVPATFDADSGIVEVFPTDKEWTGVTLGIRCDVGPGAFVRLTGDERRDLVAKLDHDGLALGYLALTEQQAAQWFRNGISGCQFEGGRMRWWSRCGLYRLERVGDQGWALFAQPERTCDGIH